MPLTLADFARLSTDPVKRGVVMTWQMESFLMDKLPWEAAGTLHIEVIRMKKAPVPTWRKLNASFTEDKATAEPIQEQVFDIGGNCDVDYQLVHATNQIVNPRSFQTEAYSKAIAYAVNDVLINGDPTVNEDALIGLKYRIMALLPAAQHINLAGLDVSPDAAGLAANEDTLLDALNSITWRLDGHKGSCIVCNDTLFLRLQSALRKKGLLSQTQDQFGRIIYSFLGMPIIDLGFTTPDGTTKVIIDTEPTDGSLYGSAAGSTSLYVLRTGGQYVNGFYQYPMRVEDLGLIDSGVHYRTLIEWPIGIYMVNPRSVARLSGIVAA